MRRLTLSERRPEPGVSLSAEERHALARIAPSRLTIVPSEAREGCYDITPSSWVGAINLGTLAIEIRPKLPISRVLFLLSYAVDPRRWEETGFDFGEEQSLLEAIVPGFAAQVRRALHRGTLRGYRSEEAALPTVRGRLRFDDQIRDHFGLLPPAEVRYDEFTDDIEENRLIKAALDRLGRMVIRSEAARRLLRTFDVLLGMVALVQYNPQQLPDIVYTRLNEHYRPAVELAKLVLRNTSFELRHGRVRASAFLVDMNRVFEDFVVTALRDALRLPESTFPQGGKGKRLRLDQAGSVRLRPDLSWWDGSICTFVGDVKYKQTDAEDVEHPDLYQLLAYTIGTDLPGGMLVYAAGEAEPVTHRVVHLGKVLQVEALDLQGSPDDILRQVGEVAERVRRLRRLALTDRVAA